MTARSDYIELTNYFIYDLYNNIYVSKKRSSKGQFYVRIWFQKFTKFIYLKNNGRKAEKKTDIMMEFSNNNNILYRVIL